MSSKGTEMYLLGNKSLPMIPRLPTLLPLLTDSDVLPTVCPETVHLSLENYSSTRSEQS
jgi:hypothetical protein